MESNRSEEAVSVIDLLLLIAENIRLIVLGSLAVGVITLGLGFLAQPVFTASTRILPPQQPQSSIAMLASQLGPLSGLVGSAGLNLKSPADLYVALLRSRTVADHLIERFKLLELYEAEFKEDARKGLESVTTIIAGKDGIITIEVDDTDPRRAADIANAYVEELARLNSNLAITEAQQRRAFFQRELEAARENLKKSQLALSDAGVSESVIKASPDAAVEAVARLKAMVTAQEVKVATMHSYLTERSPELQLAQRELASLRSQLQQRERSSTSPGAPHAEYLSLYRDFKYHEALFELMAKQFEAARIDEAREGAIVQVIDRAVPPEKKSKPKRALRAIFATLVAGFILVLYVLGREALRRAMVDPNFAVKWNRIRRVIRRKA